MRLTLELDVEEDGRIIAEVVELPGVLVYGQTEEEAITKVQALALRVLVDPVENDEAKQRTATLIQFFPNTK